RPSARYGPGGSLAGLRPVERADGVAGVEDRRGRVVQQLAQTVAVDADRDLGRLAVVVDLDGLRPVQRPDALYPLGEAGPVDDRRALGDGPLQAAEVPGREGALQLGDDVRQLGDSDVPLSGRAHLGVGDG